MARAAKAVATAAVAAAATVVRAVKAAVAAVAAIAIVVLAAKAVATAARVPISMRPEELGGDELGMNGMFTKIKPETMAAMVLTGIEGVPLHKVPPLELVVLHPDYAVVKLPMTVVDPLRGIGEEAVGAAAFIWSTVPDRGGPRDAFNVYQLLHEWQDFSHRLHEAGHQPYCLVWP